MLRLSTLEELDRLRLAIPPLVDAYDRADVAFTDEVRKWLTTVEQTLSARRISTAGGIAALRATLLASGHGVVPEGVTMAGRVSPRKLHDAVAAGVLRKADDLLADVTRGAALQFDEADRYVRQLLAVARRKGLIVPDDTPSARWSRCENDPELGAVTTHVAGLVGAADASVLLDRAAANSR